MPFRIVASVVAVALFAAAAPLAQMAPASAAASGGVAVLGDTTAADFAAGTLVNGILTTSGDGEITAPVALNTFSSTTLPSSWTATPLWAWGRTSVDGGDLDLDGAMVQSVATNAKGTTLEFDAVFRPELGQEAGFNISAQNGVEKAVFATTDAGGFSIQVNGVSTVVPTAYLGALHRYKIVWGSSAFTFSIDNVAVGSIPWTVASGLRVTFWDGYGTDLALTVDNVQVGSYSAKTVFTSRVLDAGVTTAWGMASWTVDLPVGSSMTVNVRGGNTPVPGVGWSAFKAFAPGAPLGLNTRYLQYQATLNSTSMFEGPVLKDLTFAPAPSTPSTYVMDTTAAQFAAGSRGSGVLSRLGDGEISAPAVTAGTGFASSAVLPAGWTSTPWASGGKWWYADGGLRVDAAKAAASATYPRGSVLEFDATFSGAAGETAGWVLDSAGVANALFSTESDGELWITANGTRTQISSQFLGGMHRYKIAWGNPTFTFSVDGVVVGTLNWNNSTAKRATFGDATLGGTSLLVDNVSITPYSGSYSFVSRVFDAGSKVTWNKATWAASVPNGTALAVNVRSGDTVSPGSTWTTYKSVTKGASFESAGRYLQYQAVFTSSVPLSSASLEEMRMDWGPYVPPVTTTAPGGSTTTTSSTTTTTTLPVRVSTATTVEEASAVYGDDSVVLSAVVTSVDVVSAGSVTFSVSDATGSPLGESVSIGIQDGIASAVHALPAGTKPGVYGVKAIYEGDGTLLDSNGSGVLNIEKAVLSITPDDKSKVYGVQNPLLTASFAGLRGSDTAAVLDGDLLLSTDATPNSAIGSYRITASGVTSDLYDVTYRTGTLTVAQAALRIIAEDKMQTYGGPPAELTVRYEGFVGDDGPSSLGGALSFSTAYSAASGVGRYVIDVDGVSSPNYAIEFIPGTLTVDKARATVKVVDATKVYGQENPPFALAAEGLAPWDDVSALGSPVFASSVDRSTGVGAYPVDVSGLSSENYEIVTVSGVLTVEPAPLMVRADDKVKAYGAAVPGLTASFDGFVNGDGPEHLVTMPLMSTAAAVDSATGSYVITVGGASSPDYRIVHVEGRLDIREVALVVRVDDLRKVYGTDNPAFTVSFDGFVNGDSPASLEGSLRFDTEARSDSAVGGYQVRASGLSSENYRIEVLPGTLMIDRASLIVTVQDAAKIYGQKNPSFTASASGLRQGDRLGEHSFISEADQFSSAGTYTVQVTGLQMPNYDVTAVAGVLTVEKARLRVAVNDVQKIYGQSAPIFTASYQGFVAGDQVEDLGGTLALTTSVAPEGAHVGSYPVSADGIRSDDYDIEYVDGVFEVLPTVVSVTVKDADKIYGSENPDFDLSVQGLVHDDDVTDLGTPTFSTPATSRSDAGVYQVAVSGLSSNDYVVETKTGALTVVPAPLTVRADDKSMRYGAAVPSLTATYEGFVNGDGVSSLDVLSSMETMASGMSPVGIYVIHAPVVVNRNYAVTAVPGLLTVGQAALTVTVDPASKRYGAENPALTISFDGFVNGDGPGALRGVAEITTEATATSSVGSYRTSARGLFSGDYEIRFVDGSLNVLPAVLTVSVDDSNKIYGDKNPAFSATLSGLVAGDVIESLQFRTSADRLSGTGEYVVSAFGVDDPNYVIEYVDATLQVSKAPLLISAGSGSKVYGAAMPPIDTTVIGLRNGDTASSLATVTDATASSQVGRYSTSVSPLVSMNYEVTTEEGIFEITPAAATVTVKNDSRLYGSPNPLFVVTADGLTNGDGIEALGTPSFVTDAGTSSSVGTYAVTASGFASRNYVLTLQDGTLEVLPAPLTVRADDKFKTYGGMMPGLSATYEGLVNGDSPATLDAVGALTTSASNESPAGEYRIAAPRVSDENYVVAMVDGTLTVGTAVLTISVDSSSKIYGSVNPAFAASFSGFVNGDGPSVLRGVLTFTTSAVVSSAIGSYPVQVDGVAARDYDVRFVAGDLRVLPATLTVTVNNATKVYGTDNPSFSITAAGFVNGDTAAVITGSPAFVTSAVRTSDVGSYAVNAVGLASANYTIVHGAGTLKITPAALKVTAKDSTRVYGAVDPTFGVTYSGFVNDDAEMNLTSKAVVTSNATAKSPVGSYVLSASGVVSSNYTVSYVTGKLIVTQAPLTVEADDKSKQVGELNPSFTATTSGLVNGESMSVLGGAITFSTTATKSSGAGTYPINVGGLTAINYKITFVPGTLSVNAPDPDDWNDDETDQYMKGLDALFKNLGGYSLNRQQVNCKTGSAIGSSLLVQSRSASGKLSTNFDFKDATVGTCWRLELTLTKFGAKIQSPVFKLRKY